MTLTIALIINAVLMAGIVAVLAVVMRIPFRLDRPHVGAHTVARSEAEDAPELSRAA